MSDNLLLDDAQVQVDDARSLVVIRQGYRGNASMVAFNQDDARRIVTEVTMAAGALKAKAAASMAVADDGVRVYDVDDRRFYRREEFAELFSDAEPATACAARKLAETFDPGDMIEMEGEHEGTYVAVTMDHRMMKFLPVGHPDRNEKPVYVLSWQGGEGEETAWAGLSLSEGQGRILEDQVLSEWMNGLEARRWHLCVVRDDENRPVDPRRLEIRELAPLP